MGILLTFHGIPSDRVDEFWHLIEPVLMPVILRTDGRHTAVTTRRSVIDEKFQLWAGFADETLTACKFAVVTQTVTYPTGIEELEIVFCSGDVIPDSLPLLKLIEAWAVSVGCTKSSLIGRRGWSRVLKDYKESAVVLQKDLAA